MSDINTILEGKNKGKKITGGTMLYADCWFSKNTISSYTVIDENNKAEYSFWKGVLGRSLLGAGGLALGIGGKSRKEYLISIEWKDGEKSLILIDDEYYKVLVKSMF